MLNRANVNHVLNAKLHKKEADIVAEAGKPGVVTIATNMAVEAILSYQDVHGCRHWQ